MMTRRVQGLVSVDVVPIDERIVLERVIDLDRGSLEERTLAVLVIAAGHSIASRLPASST